MTARDWAVVQLWHAAGTVDFLTERCLVRLYGLGLYMWCEACCLYRYHTEVPVQAASPTPHTRNVLWHVHIADEAHYILKLTAGETSNIVACRIVLRTALLTILVELWVAAVLSTAVGSGT